MSDTSRSQASLAYRRFVPHSIEDRGYWRRIGTEAAYKPVREVIDLLTGSAPFRPVLPMAGDYLAAKRYNDRSRGDWHWHVHRPHLTSLAMRRCILGIEAENRDDRLLNWLWDLLNQPTWAVAAHLPDKDLPSSGTPTIDLGTCDMLLTMSELLEAIKPWIDAQSTTLADSIVFEIDRRVLTPFGEGYDAWWARPDTDTINNWTGVCAGSILAACEALAALGQPRPKPRKRALELLNAFFDRGFTASGECDEGAIYWSYGVGMACTGLSRLDENELRRSIDMRRLKQVAEYPQRIHLSVNLFFSGNDARLHHAAEIYFVPWLALAVDSPWLMQWARQPSSYPMNIFGRAQRNLEGIDILAETGAREAKNPSASPRLVHKPAQLLEDQQVAILRMPISPGGAGETIAGEMIACLSGGHNAERHNHNDLGHFLITLDDRVIVPDLGSPEYKADFFGPNRYKYLPASSRGHCCPIIGGYEQRDGKEAAGKILAWKPDDPSPVFELELSAAYPPEVGLISWRRSLRRIGDHFVIADHYQTKSPREKITHVIWSTEPTFAPLALHLTPQPREMQVTPVDPAAHRLREWHQMLYQVHALYETDDEGKLSVASEFCVA